MEQHYLALNHLALGHEAMRAGRKDEAIAHYSDVVTMEDLPPALVEEAREALKSMDAKPLEGAKAPESRPARATPARREARHSARPQARSRVMLSGRVTGGGSVGPGGTVVWLRPLDRPAPKPRAVKRVIRQRNKKFTPHVLAVPVGGKVDFVNDDEIHHNVFSLSNARDFDSGIYGKGGVHVETFKKPGPVELLCNIHASMNAYIYVVDSPYYTVARGNGAFRIPNLPPGRYRLSAWHRDAAKTVNQDITVGPTELAPIVVSVDGDRPPRGPAPDKYGHPRQHHIGY
jgi:plastocyanin